MSFVVRAQFWRGRTKEFAILVNRIFPTLLAAWSRQQYPCTWVKLSFTVLISQSDKKKEYFKFYFDRSILHPDGVDSSVAFLGAIRLALIAWPPKYDNICIKMFLVTSVYSILSYYSLLSEFLLTQKTCVIYSSLLVVFIPWRSLSKRRNASEINEKLTTTRSLPLRCWLVFVRKVKKRNFCFVVYFIFWLNLVIYFYPRHLRAPATFTRTRTRTRDLYPRHWDILSVRCYCETHKTVNTRNIYGMLLCCEK